MTSQNSTPPLAAPKRLVVVAASAGGLAALTELLAPLPADFPAAIVVVQHVAPGHNSMLAPILQRRTALRVQEARPGNSLQAGTVYVAPPGHHIYIRSDGCLDWSDAEPINFLRPAADFLFQSAAESYNDQTVAVVLTGTRNDGAAGVEAIKRAGGITIAQDEATSEFFGMPAAAIATGAIDFILPIGRIAATLQDLLRKEPS